MVKYCGQIQLYPAKVVHVHGPKTSPFVGEVEWMTPTYIFGLRLCREDLLAYSIFVSWLYWISYWGSVMIHNFNLFTINISEMHFCKIGQ